MRKQGSRLSKSRGQSLVEAAITLPIVLLLSLGVTDIGRSFFYREAVTNSVRQALRIAVSSYQHGTADSVCASTTGGPLAVTVTSAVLESSKDGTPAGSVIAGATLTVTFHCLNGAAITNATAAGNAPSNAGSDSITASISKPMSVVDPLLWPMTGGSYPIKITSSQRTEY